MSDASEDEVTRPVVLPPRDAGTLAAAVEVLPDAIFVHTGPDHVVSAVNRSARGLVGDEACVGRPARRVYPTATGHDLVALLDRAYATGEAITASEWRFVVERRDGRQEERHVDFVMTPFRDGRGTVAGVVTRFVDATAALRRRQALETDTVELKQRYEAAQEVVLRLQRTLLAPGLPVLPGLRMAARYLVAGAELAAGGDWFDAVALDGRVAAVVGDVVGHGAEAAAVMGQLRAVLGELLHDAGPDPDLVAVLARLDRAASRLPGARGATVCLAVLDPQDGALSYVCAGHPPPLVIAPDGATRFLPVPGGGPLGAPGPSAEVGATVLAPGELLVCFSDGLVERTGQDLALNAGELAGIAARAVRSVGSAVKESADRVAAEVVEKMTRDGHEDDVTVLVLHRTGSVAPDLRVDVRADPQELAGVRKELLGWLTAVGAGAVDAAAVEIAVLEAVSNAMQHAYEVPGGRVRVDGFLDGSGRACLSVADDGLWRAADPDPGDRGRGLTMIRSCMDQVEVERGSEGTTVLLDLALHTPPVFDAVPAARPAGRHARSGLSVAVTRGASPKAAVGGPVDIATVPALRRELRQASRGGALPLTIDLAGVTHLASAGIELLYSFVEEMQVDGRRVELIAPPGSPAGYALGLSGLDRLVKE